jgi:hypothetical protein
VLLFQHFCYFPKILIILFLTLVIYFQVFQSHIEHPQCESSIKITELKTHVMHILLPSPRAAGSWNESVVEVDEAKKSPETLDPLWPLKGLDDHEVFQEKLCSLRRCGDQGIPLSLSEGAL